jgi:acyl-CoA synthetase (AMP-forming)/AMP-acid ligase II|tara:strand:+ start:6606 stop:8165 length:1560 start_codon:yes stop_codon:yes gene_type:complete
MRLHDYLEYYARENPDHPYAEMDGVVVSYGEADIRANQIAHALLSAGLAKGDRFSYLSKNSIDMAIMFFAASKVGIVPVPLNYRLAPKEWLYIVTDSESKLLLAADEFLDGIDSIRNELESVHTFVDLSDSSRDDWLVYNDWLASVPDTKPNDDVAEEDQLYQMYTSGTTGLPKGAMLSQKAVDSNLHMIAAGLQLMTDDRFMVAVPMYHAAAGISLMTSARMGVTIVIHREFDPVAVVNCLEKDRISSATLVPAMIQACLVSVPDIAERSYPHLRYLAYGASPIAQETLREAMRVFDCEFFQVFGMTETAAAATGLGGKEHHRALSGEPGLLLSAGRAILGTQIKIVDEDDNEVDRGTIGEVCVKGPQLMMGYWNLPEETEKALKGGWMHTGDAAYMDDEGFIYIQDRIKDMIVSGGENIYPKEVEDALFEHPAVADAAVIGIPSEQWGEAVLAFITLKQGEQVTPDEFIEFCRPLLAGYKIPRQIEFIDQIPRNVTGKILKKDLREPYWRGVERRVS